MLILICMSALFLALMYTKPLMLKGGYTAEYSAKLPEDNSDTFAMPRACRLHVFGLWCHWTLAASTRGGIPCRQ